MPEVFAGQLLADYLPANPGGAFPRRAAAASTPTPHHRWDKAMKDFDLAALSEALDARRRELGLTWQELALQVTDRPSRRSGRRIAASTFQGMSRRGSVRTR